MTKIEEILEDWEMMKNHETPDDYPAIQMRDITTLCKAVKGAIPALDLLEARLADRCTIVRQDAAWCLLDRHGEHVCSGKTLREMLVNLIFTDG